MNDDAYPVEAYLDELFDRLAGTGNAGRRALAEAEDHLRAATDERIARGVDRRAAELQAVAAFGPAEAIAAELRAVHRPNAWLRPAFVAAWLAGGLGLVVVGVSGLVAEVLGRVFGAAFVAGDGPGVTYTVARCAQYVGLFPNAGGCAQAAAMDHWGEVVQSRVAVGVLGLLALGALQGARRTTALGGAAWRPPAGSVTLPMAALFALAGAGLLGVSGMQLAFGDTAMVGANLSTGSVALATATACLLTYARRRPPA